MKTSSTTNCSRLMASLPISSGEGTAINLRLTTMCRIYVMVVVVVITCLGTTPTLYAQDQFTGTAGGSGGSAFTLSCPQNMILIGIQGKSANYIDQIQGVCSRYNAEGVRIGNTATTTLVGGTGGIIAPTSYRLTCSGQTALRAIRGTAGTTIAGTFVDQIEIFCSAVNSNGTATAPSFESTRVGLFKGNASYDLTCPNQTFARTIRGRASSWLDRVQLGCTVAPLAATSVRSVSLGTPAGTSTGGVPFYSGISGNSFAGTVTLNGYALNATNVTLQVNGAPGATVNNATVPQDAQTAPFTLNTANTTAGCARVIASAFSTQKSATSILTPPVSASAGYQFFLVNPPPGPRYLTGVQIPGRICFGVRGCTTLAGSIGNVTFTSSAPGVVSVPASASFNPLSTALGVAMSAVSQNGCAVVTSTLNGISIRKTILVDVLPQ